MSPIKFKIAAKTDVGRVRENNEDNFQAACDLTTLPMRWVNDQECMLGSKGALLVVADGMGGMNAGEVASEIVIDTVRDYFRPEHITDEVVRTRYTIERFMKNAILEADNRIKMTARERPETHGMGTTVVIAWIFDRHLYVSWCGDSRAYIYNPAYGLRPLTRDHSYVQDLVDRGTISAEDAFDYPDSNIITRSLSDASTKARPDCLLMPHELCDGDVVLLCTDGLNGMIRDEEIEQVVAAHYDNMDRCADALIQAACEAAGHDNVTVALCQILAGGGVASQGKLPAGPLAGAPRGGNETQVNGGSTLKPRRAGKWLPGIIGLMAGLILGGAICFLVFRGDRQPGQRIGTPLDPAVSGKPEGVVTDTVMPQDTIMPRDTVIPTDTVTPRGTEGSQTVNGKKKEKTAGTKKGRQPALAGNAGIEKKEKAEQPAQGEGEKPRQKEKDESETLGENPADTNKLTLIKKGITLIKEGDKANEPPSDPQKGGDDSFQEYIVQPDETLYSIAKRFGITIQEIRDHNPISDPRKVPAGQTLRIPRKKASSNDR